jgi:hypothetical protein
MPEEYRNFQTRLLMEYSRLVAFRKAAGLIQRETDDLPGSLQSSKFILVAILTEMQVLMTGFRQMTQKYSKVDADVTAGAEEKAKTTANLVAEFEALSYTESPENKSHSTKNPFQRKFWSEVRITSVKAAHVTKDVITHPDRFTWALFNAEEFLKRLERLTLLNDYLHGLLHGRDAKRLEECTQRSQLDIVMIKNTVEHLEQLVIASMLMTEQSASTSLSNKTRERNNKILVSLAESKKLRLTGDPDSFEKTIASTQPPQLRYAQILELNRPVLIAEDGTKARAAGILEEAPGKKKSIWVEWRSYRTTYDDNLKYHIPREDQVKRIKLLVSLLKSVEANKEFCLPTCLGYFDDQGEIDDHHPENPYQFGLVFEKPAESPVPISLHHLIRDVEGEESEDVPSLTTRAALASKVATCVLFLHAISWLHHDVRSSSVIFPDSGNISMPLLSGFDYSRPDTAMYQTVSDPIDDEEPDEKTLALRRQMNLARHPEYQGSGRKQPYRKRFDVYGLGIVLLEIAFWRRIEDIVDYPADIVPDFTGMEEDEVKKLKAELAKKVKTQVAKAETLKAKLENPKSKEMNSIKTNFGEKYHGAVLSCIQGPKAFGVDDTEEEMDILVGMKFQRGFTDLVVNALAEIRT